MFEVLIWIILVNYCHCQTVDELIRGAMKSPAGYDLVNEQTSGLLRVDLDMLFTINQWEAITKPNESNRDIRLSSSNYLARPELAHDRPRRQAIRHGVGGYLWTNKIIPYEIDHRDFQGRHLQIIYDAMDEWTRYTCLSFVPASPHHVNKIRFVDAFGCWSHVGMAGGRQAVSLGKGCLHKGVVVHELGHVIGFHHQHTRPDRDNYIRIRRENIPDHLEYNFWKFSWAAITNLGVPYDYLSIMHYGDRSFSGNGKITIETLDASAQKVIGNRLGPSFRDIKSANILYDCRPTSCRLTDDDCPGEGFVSKDCSCWCPHHAGLGSKPYVTCGPGHDNSDNTAGYVPDVASDVCEDKNPRCRLWVLLGQCQRNHFYTAIYCRKSCGLCGLPREGCMDQHHHCGYWKDEGHCGSSGFGEFMATNCKQSCGLCRTSTDSPAVRVTTPFPPEACDVNCRDEHEMCEKWALRGECVATTDYMLMYCRRACKVCCTRDTARLLQM